MLTRILNRLFRLEEINGARRCPTYLYRWTIFKLFGVGLYLHRFVGNDWSLDCHDHPKRFTTLMLYGRYRETVLDPATNEYTHREYRAPFVRSFPASHCHRVEIEPGEECWTLVLVGRASRAWGFWHFGQFFGWRDYVAGPAKHLADGRTVCSGLEDGRGAR